MVCILHLSSTISYDDKRVIALRQSIILLTTNWSLHYDKLVVSRKGTDKFSREFKALLLSNFMLRRSKSIVCRFVSHSCVACKANFKYVIITVSKGSRIDIHFEG